jgi:hypothetical protein
MTTRPSGLGSIATKPTGFPVDTASAAMATLSAVTKISSAASSRAG